MIRQAAKSSMRKFNYVCLRNYELIPLVFEKNNYPVATCEVARDSILYERLNARFGLKGSIDMKNIYVLT